MGKNFYSYLAGEKTVHKAVDEKPIASNAAVDEAKKTDSNGSKPSNYISYMESQNKSREKGFEELAESIELADVDAINDCFKAYIEENNPPSDILEILQEEEFKKDSDDGQDRAWVNFCFPGVSSDDEADEIKSYLEAFLDAIGTPDDQTAVDMNFTNSGNGSDCNISISFKIGEQQQEGDNQ